MHWVRIMPFRKAEEERRIIVQLHMKWPFLFLTFIVGLIGLYPHLTSDVTTIPLWILYTLFASGTAYGAYKFSLGLALLLKWRDEIPPATLGKLHLPSWYKETFLKPWYKGILLNKNGDFRRRPFIIGAVIIFIFWFLAMIGKLLAST